MSSLRQGLESRGFDVAASVPVNRDWSKHRAFAAALDQGIDVVVINGEGTIHHSNERALALSSAVTALKSRGFPVAVVNAGLFENDLSVYRDLREADLVYARDRESRDEAASYGVLAKLSADLSFLSPPVGRGRPWFSGCVTDSMAPKPTEALARLGEARGWPQFPISPKIVEPLRSKIVYDIRYLRHAPLAVWPTAARYKALLANHALVVSGRYHGTCMCLAVGVPVLSMSSSTRKIEALMADVFGDERRMISAGDAPGIGDPKAYDWTAEERTALANYARTARGSLNEMLDEVAALAQEHQARRPRM